ncbi:MAG: SpoIIE family protein phosphatase [Methanothrix sp.]|nr:SpoIIE family protein phosphatase [Methanothrix sp.]MDD4446710.1 SpoIIE family protein phosphatase [Methanothrix sp.]
MESRGKGLLSDVIDFLPDAILAIDREGKVITWNRAMENMTGASAQDMIGKGNYEYALPFYGIRRPILVDLVLMPLDEVEGKYDLLQREGKTLTVEIFIPTFGDNGSYLWAKAAPLYDSQGEIAGAIESIRDITARKKGEEALLKSEQEKEAILSSLRNVAVEYLDPGMRIIWVNSAVQRSLGRSLQDLRGKYCYESIQGIDAPCPGCKAALTLQTGNSHEGELVTPDGKTWITRSNGIKGRDGRIHGVVHVAMNISKRKLAEEKIAAVKQRLADVIDFLPDATFAIDNQGKVLTWNRAMEKMTGASAQEMIGKGDYEYALPFYGMRRPILADLVLRADEEIQMNYPGLQRDGKTLTSEIFIPTFGPTGSFIWAKATPLYDSLGNIVGSIESIRDITNMRRTEQTLERSKSELRIASDIQRSFLPERIPPLPGFDLAATFIPAMEVGGDFYDFIPGEGKLGMVIADVSGKSVPAALFMALSRTIVRVNATHHEKGTDVLEDANNMISADSKLGMFVTLFYGVLDQNSRSLIYANAGHPPPLLMRNGSNAFENLEVTGIALGAIGGAKYEERRVDLSSGDVLVLYTDGVNEAENSNSEQYGIERFCSIVRESCLLSAQGILDKILDDISQFCAGQAQFDDITMVVVKAV